MDKANMFWKEDRLLSFNESWKKLRKCKLCTPENFAEAGFYNCSTPDCPDNVKCFACRKELDGWEKDDDPWEEHKRRGAACPYVALKMKNPFLGAVKAEDILKLYYEMLKNTLKESVEKSKERLEEELSVLRKYCN